MPCPPSWEEREYNNLENTSRDFKKKIHDQDVQIDDLFKLIEEIIRIDPKPFTKDFHAKLSELREAFRYELPVFTYPKFYVDLPDVERLKDFIRQLDDIRQMQEVNLCKTRDLLFKVLKDYPKENFNDEILAKINHEKELHLTHRKEDRDHVLKHLRMMAGYSFLPDAELKKIKDKIKYLEGLTDKQLLYDRDLF